MIIKMESQRYDSVTTCSRRVACHQICCYLIVLTLLATFFGLAVPRLPPRAQLALALLQAITTAGMLIATFLTSCTDPVDSVLLEYRNGSKNEVRRKARECLYC